MRAAIYSRFSTDRQTDNIAEQVEACRQLARKEGLEVVDLFEDRAITGTTAARPGLQALIAAAKAGRFQVVIAKDLSRLSRDLGNLFNLVFGDLAQLGVRVLDAQTGLFSDATGSRTVYAALGMAADAYVDFVRGKTRDGLRDRARAGHFTGGASYGFETYPDPAFPGDEPRYLVRSNEAEAAVVREIFTRWNRGETMVVIADAITATGVKAPRTNSKKYQGWGTTTVRYILKNERYSGVWRYGTHKWIKHPVTGKRRHLKQPPETHVVTHRPELAIVDDDTFARAQARFRKNKGGRPEGATKRDRPPNPFTGLVHCAECGSAYVVGGIRRGHRQLRCASHYARGAALCPNNRTVTVDKLAGLVVRSWFNMLTPEVIREMARALAAGLRQQPQQDVRAVERQRLVVRRLVDAVATLEDVDVTELVERLRVEKTKLAALEVSKPADPFYDSRRWMVVDGDVEADADLVWACETALRNVTAKFDPASATPEGVRDFLQSQVAAISIRQDTQLGAEVSWRDVVVRLCSGGKICRMPLPAIRLDLRRAA